MLTGLRLWTTALGDRVAAIAGGYHEGCLHALCAAAMIAVGADLLTDMVFVAVGLKPRLVRSAFGVFAAVLVCHTLAVVTAALVGFAGGLFKTKRDAVGVFFTYIAFRARGFRGTTTELAAGDGVVKVTANGTKRAEAKQR